MNKSRAQSCVLVADGSIGSTVQAARRLSNEGFRIYVACTSFPSQTIRRSKAIQEAADISHNDPTEFATSLIRWLTATAPPGDHVPIVPLSDRLTDWLDTTRHLIPPPFNLVMPDSDVLRPLLSKDTALTIAKHAGLDVLPWVRVGAVSDLKELSKLGYPIIVRPTSWNSHGLSYFKQQVFYSQHELNEFLIERLSTGAVLVAQEYLEASADCIEFALVGRCRDGSTSIVTGRKRGTSHEFGGVLTWGEACELPDVAAHAERFLDVSRYFGPGGIEFIRHGGRLWFIEFNPRLEAIHFLSDLSGVPLLAPIVTEAAGLQQPYRYIHKAQQSAAIWIETAWIAWLLSRPPNPFQTVVRAYQQYRRHRNRSMALFSRQDPGPAYSYLGRVISRVLPRPFRRSPRGEI